MKTILLLLIAVPIWAQVSPSSNWGTALQAVQMPTTAFESANICGIRAVKIDNQNNIWVGGCAGIWYGSSTCIAINPSTARDRSCWVDATAGLPLLTDGACGPYMAVRSFAIYSSNVYAGFGNPCLGGHKGTYIGRWTGSSWALTANLDAGADIWPIDTDASGNVYAADSGAKIWRSTDSGATASVLTSWSTLGINTGQAFTFQIWNGNMYWSGEGPITEQPLSSPTSSGSTCRILSGDNASANESHTIGSQGCSLLNTHQYAHNGRCTVSNGTAGTAYTKLVACVDDITAGSGTYLQQYDTSRQTWIRPSPVSYSSPCTPGDTTGYLVLSLAKGWYATDEMYGATGSNGGCDLIIGSTDGGATWSAVGGYKAACANNGCRFSWISVSPVDDSKIVASTGSATFTPYLYFHPSPGANASVTVMVGTPTKIGSGPKVNR